MSSSSSSALSAHTTLSRVTISAREFFFGRRPTDPALEARREATFFKSLRMANGTYKTTSANRMREVDALLCRLLPNDRVRPLDVLDAAVSSGVTTLEFLEAFESAGVARQLVAVDLTIHARLRRVAPGIELLLDSAGHVLQIHTPLLTKGRPHDPELSRKRAALQRVFDFCESMWGDTVVRSADVPVELLTPRLIGRSDVRVVEHDLTRRRDDWNQRFDVVRAANILNRSYFDEATLQRMLGHLRSYIRPGGMLVVCRTIEESGANHATIFGVGDGAFTVMARYGDGSEVEDLVLRLVAEERA